MLNELVPEEGADMGEEKDKLMAEAFRYVKEQVADEGTSIHDASLPFADHLKTIMDMVYDHASLTRSTDFCLDHKHQMPRSFLQHFRHQGLYTGKENGYFSAFSPQYFSKDFPELVQAFLARPLSPTDFSNGLPMD